MASICQSLLKGYRYIGVMYNYLRIWHNWLVRCVNFDPIVIVSVSFLNINTPTVVSTLDVKHLVALRYSKGITQNQKSSSVEGLAVVGATNAPTASLFSVIDLKASASASASSIIVSLASFTARS